METADTMFIAEDITVGIHTGVMSGWPTLTDGTSLLFLTVASLCTSAM